MQSKSSCQSILFFQNLTLVYRWIGRTIGTCALVFGLFTGSHCSITDTDSDQAINLALLAFLSQTEFIPYSVTFKATWSAATHSGGTLGIPANPHFSIPVGAVHSPVLNFWQTGQRASNGLEKLAENGDFTPVDSEMLNGGAISVFYGTAFDSPGSVTMKFSVTKDASAVTLLSMVAPSPDWFVGVGSVDLKEQGAFVSSKTMDLYMYDAGTDSGAAFIAADLDTDPQAPISLIADTPLVGNPVGTFTFKRQ